MKCPKCETEMVIDEWSGWVWTCFICDYVGRSASSAEIKNFEKNFTKEINMPKILFSHIYSKLLDSHNDVIESAKLIGVFRVNIEDLHPSFLSYDTDNGKYKLPEKGTFLMLLFLKPFETYVTDQNLFTTLRRYTPQKDTYYWQKVGMDFNIIVEKI